MPRTAARRTSLQLIGLLAVLAASLVALPGGAADAEPGRSSSAAEYWTQERMDAAIPRDLVVDEEGRGYLRRPDGTLEPYGQQRSTDAGGGAAPAVKPDNPGGGNGNGGGGGGGGGGGTDEAPTIADLAPSAGTTITASPSTFSATVTDDGSLKSVTFHVTDPSGTTTSYSATDAGSGTWTAVVELPTNGDWSWQVEARDDAKRGGNTSTSAATDFIVDVAGDGGGDPGSGTPVTNDHWTADGTVQTAAGRIYFEMPDRGPNWAGYVCSGTVATDSAANQSIIITAAHCVYDEDNDVFARNVLFIPDQDGTTGTGTNTTCTDDPLGCWEPTHGVVDDDWANSSWPDNIPWDVAYYVVPTSGAHSAGISASSESLEDAAGSLPVSFTAQTAGPYTHALGYSYSEDPNLMYCAEDLAIQGTYGSLWLGSCELSGGASGGPWVQPMDTGTGSGPIVSVNSFGYSNQPGMGGPHLSTGTASCLLNGAEESGTNTARGHVLAC